MELLTLTSTWLVALFTTVWLELLVQRHMPVTGLWIAMREVPASAVFATVHPEFGAALDQALISGTLSLRLIVIHDFIRRSATFRGEVMHSRSQCRATP